MTDGLRLNKNFTLLDTAELCVAGGGLAGVAAALTAADAGVDTVLVEERGALGWEVSHGLEIYLSGGKVPAVLATIVEQLANQKAARGLTLDPVATECLLDKMLIAKNVRLHFRAFAGGLDASKGLVRLTTKSGPLAIQAKAIIDATETSRLAAPQRGTIDPRPQVANLQASDSSQFHRAFLLCAVTPTAIETSVTVENVGQAVVRPTLWPHEAHVCVTYSTSQTNPSESNARFAIARSIETLRASVAGFEKASLSLSAHESFALSPSKIASATATENVFVAGPRVLGRKPSLEERVELGERAAALAIENLKLAAVR